RSACTAATSAVGGVGGPAGSLRPNRSTATPAPPAINTAAPPARNQRRDVPDTPVAGSAALRSPTGAVSAAGFSAAGTRFTAFAPGSGRAGSGGGLGSDIALPSWQNR